MSSSTLQGSLQSLSLSDQRTEPTKPAAHSKGAAQAVADSWEDDADDVTDAASPASPVCEPRSPTQTIADPVAPPPTPSSPHQAPDTFSRSSIPRTRLDVTSPSRLAPASERKSDVRPETSSATATRMIAAGLGLKAPGRTEEQRRYDQAMRENEKRRREQEREQKRLAEAAKEQAKRDIWDG